MITPVYGRFGYVVLQDGEEVCSAGNSPYDSTSVVPLAESLSLATLRRYASQVAHEEADKRGDPFVGRALRAIRHERLGDYHFLG